jgi:hypothetical protein
MAIRSIAGLVGFIEILSERKKGQELAGAPQIRQGQEPRPGLYLPSERYRLVDTGLQPAAAFCRGAVLPDSDGAFQFRWE